MFYFTQILIDFDRLNRICLYCCQTERSRSPAKYIGKSNTAFSVSTKGEIAFRDSTKDYHLTCKITIVILPL